MKTKTLTKFAILPLFAMAVLSLSSCLKDPRYVDLSTGSPIVDMPLSGAAYFSQDAITKSGLDTLNMAVNISSVNTLSTAVQVTVGVDNTIIAPYNTANPSVTYNPFPTSTYTFPDKTLTIPAGSREVYFSCVVNTSTLNPSLSYMLPIVIKSVSGGATISGNFSIHYYHVIGNDFAGSWIWDYRRWQNGTGPGPGIIPSNNPTNAGIPADISNIGQAGTIYPVTPNEFQMLTGYNNTGVNYDVTFTRTASGSSVAYSAWSVTFPATEIAKWTAAGITNMVPPTFTVPPPTSNANPAAYVFEMHYVSGGASGRYIDDTYHH